MGISRDSRHKRSASGARRAHYRKKRKFELGRQAAMTKLDTTKRIHTVRTRGGNVKYRAIRLDTGNFSWGSEATTRKTRLLNVVSIHRDLAGKDRQMVSQYALGKRWAGEHAWRDQRGELRTGKDGAGRRWRETGVRAKNLSDPSLNTILQNKPR